MIPAEYTYKTQVYILSSISIETTVTRRSITQGVVLCLSLFILIYIYDAHI